MKQVMQQQETKPRGIACSVPEMARLMDVTNGKIREFITEGMPVFSGGGKGKANVLSSADCIEWLRQRGFGKAGPKSTKQFDEDDPRKRFELLKLEQTE